MHFSTDPEKYSTDDGGWDELSENTKKEILDELLIDHIFDSLTFNEHFVIVNYLYTIESDEKVVNILKKKVMNEIIQDKGITGYIFYDTNGYN